MISRVSLAACIRRRTLATSAFRSSSFLDLLEAHSDNIPEDPTADPLEKSTWVRLRGLPRTVAPADLHRHSASLRLSGLKNVHIDYKNFVPTGRGWLHFETADHADRAAVALGTSQLAAHPLSAQPVAEIDIIRAGGTARGRGDKGRSEALERGLLTGNGPDARIRERGTCVYFWGLPGTTTAADLAKVLEPYGLRPKVDDEYPVVSIYRKTPTARFLVRLTTTSNAHRLTRDFHMSDKFGEGYIVRAQVVY